MAGDPRLTARPGHAACTASPETYRNPAQGSFRHAVNGTRFGPEHPNIPSREVGRFPCSALRETVQVLKNAGIKLTSWSRRSWARPARRWARHWLMWPRSGFCPERSIRRGEVLSEQMQTALTHRAIIEQAKGVLAHQGDLSMHAVFDRLRSYARNRSKRLSEAASPGRRGRSRRGPAHRPPQPTAPRPSNGNPDLGVLCAGPGDRRGANPVKTRRPRPPPRRGAGTDDENLTNRSQDR
jgi:ANTAR domain